MVLYLYFSLSHINKYNEIVESLRLDYLSNGRRIFSENAETYGIIKFKSSNANDIQIPYGEKFGGTTTDGYPCTLNGFTGSRNGEIIPEWKFRVRNLPKQGAELYEVKNGKEELLAIFDGDTFAPIK